MRCKQHRKRWMKNTVEYFCIQIHYTWPKVCGHLRIAPIWRPSTKFCHKIIGTRLSRTSFNAVTPFLGRQLQARDSNLFQHDNSRAHKAKSIKIDLPKAGLVALTRRALTSTPVNSLNVLNTETSFQLTHLAAYLHATGLFNQRLRQENYLGTV